MALRAVFDRTPVQAPRILNCSVALGVRGGKALYLTALTDYPCGSNTVIARRTSGSSDQGARCRMARRSPEQESREGHDGEGVTSRRRGPLVLLACFPPGATPRHPNVLSRPRSHGTDRALRDERIQPSTPKSLQQSDRAPRPVTRRIETDERIGTLIGNRQVIAQSRDVAVKIDIGGAQHGENGEDIRAGIETGHLIHATGMQNKSIAARAPEELDRMT